MIWILQSEKCRIELANVCDAIVFVDFSLENPLLFSRSFSPERKSPPFNRKQQTIVWIIDCFCTDKFVKKNCSTFYKYDSCICLKTVLILKNGSHKCNTNGRKCAWKSRNNDLKIINNMFTLRYLNNVLLNHNYCIFKLDYCLNDVILL